MSGERSPSSVRRPVRRWNGRAHADTDDAVAAERALEIRVDGRALSVTLRTPGDDEELALGFLASEGVLGGAADVAACTLAATDSPDAPDVVDVRLASGVTLDWSRFERGFASTAACGICGRSHLEALHAGLAALPPSAPVAAEALLALPARLRVSQATFEATGGLHAAAWCDDMLEPVVVREDVGRHNALDKVCGARLRAGSWPVGGGVLWVSGRAGAELVLKAARARVPVLAAVGAPSSLAIDIARQARMTLVGFLRDGRMNVYTERGRVG